MGMTHPDILKMERDGFLGSAPEIIGYCAMCGYVIENDGEEIFYNAAEKKYACCLECLLEATGFQERSTERM